MNRAARITLIASAARPAAAASASAPVEGLALIRAGAKLVAISGKIGPEDVSMVLEPTHGAPAPEEAGCALRGAATTHDGEGPSTHLQAARAIRRALADGRMKAGEIGLVSVTVPSTLDQNGIAPMLALALRDHLAHVQTTITVVDQPRGNGALDLGVAAACIEAVGSGRVAGAVALYLGFGDETTALAFSPHP